MFQLLITLISIVQYVYSITLSDINRVSSVSNGTQLFYIDSSSPNPSQQFPESIINYNVWDFNSQSQFQTIPTTDSKFVSNTVFYYKSQFCLLTELITINCYYPDQNKMIKQRLQPTTSLDNKSFYLSGHTITQLKDSSYIIIGGMLTPPYNSGTLKPKASSSIFRLTEDRSLSVVEYSLSKFGFNTLIGHTTHVINNQLYIIGGADPTNGNKVNNQILIFNLNNGDSETIKGLPVVYHDSFVKDNQIYILGGYNANSSDNINDNNVIPSKSVYTFNPNTNELKKSSQDLPYRLLGFTTAIKDNQCYLIGGYSYSEEESKLTSFLKMLILDLKDTDISVHDELALNQFNKNQFLSVNTNSPTDNNNNNNQSSGGSNLGAIIGGTIGGLFALFIIIFIIVYYLRKKRRQEAYEKRKAAVRAARLAKNPHDSVKPMLAKHKNPSLPIISKKSLDRRNSNASVLSAEEESDIIMDESKTIPDRIQYKSTVLSSSEFPTDHSKHEAVKVNHGSTILSANSDRLN